MTDTLRNEVITRLRQQYLDLAGREANWSQKYGASHLAVVNLRNQMQEIKRSIKDELKRISETYRSDYEIAKAREEQAQQRLTQVISQSQQTNEAQVELRDLESKSQAYRALHDNFLQRYTEAVQQTTCVSPTSASGASRLVSIGFRRSPSTRRTREEVWAITAASAPATVDLPSPETADVMPITRDGREKLPRSTAALIERIDILAEYQPRLVGVWPDRSPAKELRFGIGDI